MTPATTITPARPTSQVATVRTSPRVPNCWAADDAYRGVTTAEPEA
jgi:hypothetical protein